MLVGNKISFPIEYEFEGTIDDIYKMPLPKNVTEVFTYQKAFEQVEINGEKVELESMPFGGKTYEIANYYTLEEVLEDKSLLERIDEIKKIQNLPHEKFYDDITGVYFHNNGSIDYAVRGIKIDGCIPLDKLTFDDEKFHNLVSKPFDKELAKKVLQDNGITTYDDEDEKE